MMWIRKDLNIEHKDKEPFIVYQCSNCGLTVSLEQVKTCPDGMFETCPRCKGRRAGRVFEKVEGDT